MSDEGNGESGISRWSRLKRTQETPKKAVVEDPAAPESPPLESPPLESPPEDGAQAPVPAPETEAGDEAGEPMPELPPVESLTKDSDYTPFLADGVPEALTRAALRKLWTSDPVLANLDGLNDYDEDFRIIDTVVKAVEKLADSRDGEDGEDEKQSEESPEPEETAASGGEKEEDNLEGGPEDGNEPEDTDAPTSTEEQNDGSQNASTLPEGNPREPEEV